MSKTKDRRSKRETAKINLRRMKEKFNGARNHLIFCDGLFIV